MVRELKKFKAHYQQKKEELERKVQNSVSAFDDIGEKILRVDPDATEIVKSTKGLIALHAKGIKRPFEMYERKLRDLEELKIDVEEHCSENHKEMFLRHEKEALVLADQKVTSEVFACIVAIEKDIAIMKPLSEIR